ncbi:MAG: hypothetical protein ACOX52_06000 [Verrucomicrobiota bacterium]
MAPCPLCTAQTSLPSCVSNETTQPGFSCLNPISRTFDSEPDSDPDPDLASPLTFSDDLWREAH